MNKEEFLKLSQEEMYNKYNEADIMRSANLSASMKADTTIREKNEEIASLQQKVADLKNAIIILGRML